MTRPLSGRTVFVIGRLPGMTRARVRELIRASGGRVARNLHRGVSVVVVAHAAAPQLRTGVLPSTLFDQSGRGTEPMSELSFRRLLGLSAPGPAQPRTIPEENLLAIAGLDEFDLYWMRLFDVVGADGAPYSFRDLVAARTVGQLLRQGMDLGSIMVAAVQLRRSQGLGLAEARLSDSPLGPVRVFGDRLAELDGQYRLDLGAPTLSVDQLFDMAEQLEREGIWDQAERFYRVAGGLDHDDPVLPFNLGNVLKQQGRLAEAMVAWREALARDPFFAEALFNLAIAAEERERPAEAEQLYRRAIEARPDYADATYNLALLLYRRGQYGAAVPIWDRYLNLDPRSRWAERARRYAALCRLESAR